jgi:hypothetical protein
MTYLLHVLLGDACELAARDFEPLPPAEHSDHPGRSVQHASPVQLARVFIRAGLAFLVLRRPGAVGEQVMDLTDGLGRA